MVINIGVKQALFEVPGPPFSGYMALGKPL